MSRSLLGTSQQAVPHLQRLAPDRSALATWDGDNSRLVLRSFAGTEASPPRMIRVTGLTGRIQTFRWHPDGQSVVIQTNHALALVALDAGDAVAAEPFMSGKSGRSSRDFRMVAGGVLVHSRSNQLWFRRFDQPTPIQIGAGEPIHAAGILSGDRIAVVTGTAERTIRTVDLSDGAPRITAERPCRGDCRVMNWAPGAERVTFATQGGRVVHELPADGGPVRMLDLSAGSSRQRVHTLWLSDDQTQLLAADEKGATLWDSATGRQVWRFVPEGSERLLSAHFSGGGVVVTLNRRVVRLENGQVVGTLVSTKQAAELNVTGGAFLEGAELLPDGGLAFSVVRPAGGLGAIPQLRL